MLMRDLISFVLVCKWSVSYFKTNYNAFHCIFSTSLYLKLPDLRVRMLQKWKDIKQIVCRWYRIHCLLSHTYNRQILTLRTSCTYYILRSERHLFSRIDACTCGCMGSAKLHININDGVMIILEALSTLSSNDISSAHDTAMMPWH